MTNDIARFEYSTDEAFYYVLEFVSGLTLTGRSFEVLVKDRASNTVRATLTLGSGLTMVSATEISAAVTRPAMADWPRGEYQADLVDITGGARSRIMAVRFVYDYPGNLVYGVRDRKAFINWGPNRAYVTATGAVGPVGPPGTAATITVGDVQTVAPGEPADVRNSGTATAAVFDFDIPAGPAATVAVGDVQTVMPGEPADVRNSGTSAAAVLDFDIPAGEAATVAVGDVTTIAAGEPADVRNSGTATAAVLDFDIPAGEKGDQGDQGQKGWSPVLATISDGARRVHQVIDWTGGEGAKPATGDYIGLTGLVPNIADGIDIRGPAGTATIPDGDKGDITTSSSGDVWTIDDGAVGTAKLADRAATFAKVQDIATARLLGRSAVGSGGIEELSADGAESVLKGATRRLFPLGNAGSPGVAPDGDTNTGIFSPGADQLAFSAGGTERARIGTGGTLLIGGTSEVDGSGYKLQSQGSSSFVHGAGSVPVFITNSGASTQTAIAFRQGSPAAQCGSISLNAATSTSYNTSSDYRLKENIIPIPAAEAVTAVLGLRPVRFNFKSAPSMIVDGFLAHEVDEAVPLAHAVTGEKDGEEMQGIDPGKLIATLTSALQWAIREIEQLRSDLDSR
jgi:hypothetical protein